MFLSVNLQKKNENYISSMHNILEKRGISYRKTAIDITANLILLRFQIVQDYSSKVTFILSKIIQNKNIKLKKEHNNKSSRCGKLCKLNLFIPFLNIVHDQKNLLMCSYLN